MAEKLICPAGIVKRFLDALKAEQFARDVFPFFLEALTTLVKCNMTADVFRFLALFITYAYHKPASLTSRTSRAQSGTLPNRTGTSLSGSRRPIVVTTVEADSPTSPVLSKRQIGNKILEMYTDLLCEKGNFSTIRKFGKTVTSKVRFPHLATPDLADDNSGSYIYLPKTTQKWWYIPRRLSPALLSCWDRHSLPNLLQSPAALPSCVID